MNTLNFIPFRNNVIVMTLKQIFLDKNKIQKNKTVREVLVRIGKKNYLILLPGVHLGSKLPLKLRM